MEVPKVRIRRYVKNNKLPPNTGELDPAEVGELIKKVRGIAREYRAITGRPLGITGEVAEYEAARLLDLKLCVPRQAGYDAFRADGTKVQIKGRVVTEGTSQGQSLGSLRLDQKWDSVLLVLLDEDLEPVEIHEAQRHEMESALSAPGSRRKKAQEALDIRKFQSISKLVWKKDPNEEGKDNIEGAENEVEVSLRNLKKRLVSIEKAYNPKHLNLLFDLPARADPKLFEDLFSIGNEAWNVIRENMSYETSYWFYDLLLLISSASRKISKDKTQKNYSRDVIVRLVFLLVEIAQITTTEEYSGDVTQRNREALANLLLAFRNIDDLDRILIMRVEEMGNENVSQFARATLEAVRKVEKNNQR